MSSGYKSLKNLADSFNAIRASDLDSLWQYAQNAQAALDAAADELEMRERDRFEQKVVDAAWGLMDGNPLKDFLEDAEIEEAIKRLSDIYAALGRSPSVERRNTK